MGARHVLASLLLSGLVVWAACGGEGQQQTEEEQLLALGQQTYRRACITCHQADGNGISGVYPPLQQTEWVLGDRGRLIRLVLNGMEGPVEVNGQTYNQVMQPFDYLSDEQIAAVLTFVRQNFGNDAGAVTPMEVAAVRAANERDDLWRPDELWEQTGIPDTSAVSSE